ALAVTRDQRERLRMLTMRERNACIRRATCRSGNAWNDFESDAVRCQRLELFAAPAENERVAALQAAHALALLREPDEQGVNVLLRNMRAARSFPDIDSVRVSARKVQHRVRDESVVQNDIGV